MKKIYISNGVNNRYSVSETRIDHLDGKSFDSYTSLVDYLKSDDKEVRRMRTRELTVVVEGMSTEKIKKLEKDILEAGFKQFKGITKD